MHASDHTLLSVPSTFASTGEAERWMAISERRLAGAGSKTRPEVAFHLHPPGAPGTAAMSTNIVQDRAHGIEWCVASQALPGQAVSGDLHLVKSWSEGVLFAVVDGLGHGEEATLAARRAVETLAQRPEDSPIALMQHCHAALRETRGAVVTLVSLRPQERTATMLGVGNVEAVLLHVDPRTPSRRESVLLRGGVVGYQLPALQISHTTFAPGDVLVFATDGLREDFGDVLRATDSVAQMAETVMSRKFRGTDDALVLAGKFVGTT